MAGNLLYMPYTFLMIIGLIILFVIIMLKKGKRAVKVFLSISVPVLILFQFYFWNLEFNNYVKSYLFPSKAFKCADIEELKSLSIPLPERTVFKGKEDGCSPFYLTYVNVNGFKSYYQKELQTLKDTGKIQNYRYENKGYLVELSSGSKIDIFFHRREGESGLISIDYNSK
ncbi:hypothetical protein D3H35_11005 [Cohnella faecalis]|uniref:Uncharacterized protein n=1 Tax=Cohnella faecalis TaxID=2315694 RepID=A0A398CQL6_9BACL|nr:hypothetical protein D3H35_11005 [Cohnella faecalis]